MPPTAADSSNSGNDAPRKTAPSAFSAIYGMVTDSAGNPIADATVEIAGKKPFSTFSLRSSASGMFHLDSLVVGETYTIAVTRFGFRATETQPFVAKADSARNITVVLHPRRTVVISAQGQNSRPGKKPATKPTPAER